jgi:hypothetical protein
MKVVLLGVIPEIFWNAVKEWYLSESSIEIYTMTIVLVGFYLSSKLIPLLFVALPENLNL